MNVGLAVGVGIGVAVGVYVGIVVGSGVFVRVGVGATVGLDGYLGGRVGNGVNVGVVVSLGVIVIPGGSVAASEFLGVGVSDDSVISVAPNVCNWCGVFCAGLGNEGVGYGMGVVAQMGHEARWG